METLYLKSIEFLDEFVTNEIKEITKLKAEKIENTKYYKINIEFDKIFEITYKIINLSRTIEKIYLENNSLNIGEYNFLKDKIKIKNKEINVYDLSSNILENRNYLINHNSNTLNHNIINYCLFKLNLHKKKSNYSIIDLIANNSEILLEAVTFNPKKPLYINDRYEMQIFKEFKKFNIKIPKFEIKKDKNKYISIVQSSNEFKKSKENLNKLGYKIKISKVDIEWIDLKHEEKSFDYIISSFPIFKTKEAYERFLDEFLTQAKYLCKKQTCIISKEKLNEKLFKKYNFKLEFENEIKYDIITYYIYILK